jgi:hypothetical protein
LLGVELILKRSVALARNAQCLAISRQQAFGVLYVQACLLHAPNLSLLGAGKRLRNAEKLLYLLQGLAVPNHALCISKRRATTTANFGSC